MFFGSLVSQVCCKADWRGGAAVVALTALAAIAALGYRRFSTLPEVLAPHGADLVEYVGAAKCAECHVEIYNQQRRSRMAETLHTAEGYVATHSLPLPAVVFDERNHVRYRVEKRDHKLELEAKRDREIARAEMAYALGSGKFAVTFVGEVDDATYEELRVSYYADSGAWDLTPGQKGARPTTAKEALGRPFEKRIDGACLNCHASLLLQTGGKLDPARSHLGVDCERCHGPGRDHVDSAAKASPAKLCPPELDEGLRLAQRLREGQPPANAEEELLQSLAEADDERLIRDLYVCGECHGRREITSPPNDDLLSKFPVAALAASACYRQSATRLLCRDCHDPHGDSPRDDTDYVAVCLKCHQESPTPPAREAPHNVRPEPAGTPAVSQQNVLCPVNPRDGCIACHMPTQSPIPHAHFAHHRIAVYRGHDGLGGVVGRGHP
jgi:hypothetical protein